MVEINGVDPDGGTPVADAQLGSSRGECRNASISSLDENRGGTIIPPQISTGTYTVASNGRVTLTGFGGTPPILVSCRLRPGVYRGSGYVAPASGVIEPQAGPPPYSNLFHLGTYLGGTVTPVQSPVMDSVSFVLVMGRHTTERRTPAAHRVREESDLGHLPGRQYRSGGGDRNAGRHHVRCFQEEDRSASECKYSGSQHLRRRLDVVTGPVHNNAPVSAGAFFVRDLGCVPRRSQEFLGGTSPTPATRRLAISASADSATLFLQYLNKNFSQAFYLDALEGMRSSARTTRMREKRHFYDTASQVFRNSSLTGEALVLEHP